MQQIQTSLKNVDTTLGYLRQESLADAKVTVRRRSSSACVKAPSEEIYSKSTICDFLLMTSSNRGRITYGLRDIFVCRG